MINLMKHLKQINIQIKSLKDIKVNIEVEDIDNLQLDEIALRKQQHLRIQGLQNFKCSFGNESFQIHSKSILRSSPLMKQEDTLTEVLATQSQTENSKRELTNVYKPSQQPPQLLTKISENNTSRQQLKIQINKSPVSTQNSETPTIKSQKKCLIQFI